MGAYLQMRKSFSRRLTVIPDHKKGTIQAVVITGCDSGLGYSLALYCSDLGFKVIATVLEPRGPAAERLRELGCLVYKVDYTSQNDVKQFANEIDALIRDSRDDWEIRALVNNAAVMMFGEFEWLLPKHVETHFEVNVLGPMKLTQELLPILRKDKSRLINVVSHCALEALPGLSVYSGTKSAMLGWNNALRVELGKYGVKVVAFVPGSIVACLLVATVAATPFTNCQEGAPPSALRVEGCDKAPCKLRRGSNVSAEWDFTVTTSYTPFSKCMKGDKFETSPLELRIDGCRESPCILHKGTTMTAEWDFAVSDCAEPHRLEVRVGELLLFVWPYVEFCSVSQLLIVNDRTCNVLCFTQYPPLLSWESSAKSRYPVSFPRDCLQIYIYTSLHGCKQRLEGKCGFDENGKLERTYRSSNPSFCRIRCTVRERGRLLGAVPLLYNCATGRFQPSVYLVLRSPCATCTRLHGEEKCFWNKPSCDAAKNFTKNSNGQVTGPRALRAEGAGARLRAEPIQCNKYPMTTARGEDFARRLVVARVLTLATRRALYVYARVLTEVGNTRGPNKARTSRGLRSSLDEARVSILSVKPREQSSSMSNKSRHNILSFQCKIYSLELSRMLRIQKRAFVHIAAATGCTARVSFPIIGDYHCRLKRKKRCSKLKLPVESWRKKKKIARCASTRSSVFFVFPYSTSSSSSSSSSFSRGSYLERAFSFLYTYTCRGQRAAPAAAIFHSGGSSGAQARLAHDASACAIGSAVAAQACAALLPSFRGALRAYYERDHREREGNSCGSRSARLAARGAAAVAAAAAADIHTANENSTTMLSMTWAFMKCCINNCSEHPQQLCA
ncbi:unnamed protein product, partial [Trichogramma brassicae]